MLHVLQELQQKYAGCTKHVQVAPEVKLFLYVLSYSAVFYAGARCSR